MPWQTITGDHVFGYRGKFRKKPVPMMLVYGEYEGFVKKNGRWVKEKKATCRWEWLTVEKGIRRSIREWIPKESGQDPKKGEFEQWPVLSMEEKEILELALADGLDPEAPLHYKIVDDYKKAKEAADEEEAYLLLKEEKARKKDERKAAKNQDLQKKLKEVERELREAKDQLQGKSTFTTKQEAELKAEIEAQKAKNADLTRLIDDLQEVKARYQKFPAELRVLPEKELLEKLDSARDSDNTLTLLKAKVLTYFEGMLERKKESEPTYKGSLKNIMPKSMQSFFESSELA